ncbi:MAG: amino acid adenylation domain-containing protein, partial [bacterium]|nr:amino acid adenylation domain-containing protein [bacterium]
VDEQFRLSQFSNIGFDAFLKEMLVAFLAGATLCTPENMPDIINPEDLIRWVEKSKITLLHCVPGVFRQMNVETLNENNFRELKYILLSGEEIYPSELENWYDKIGERIQLINLYGTTETTILKSYYLIGKSDVQRKNIPIGKPIKGSRLIVMDGQMNICTEGVTGEIYIRTPYHTHGYYNAPQLNREKFLPNPFSDNPDDLIFKTGDLGRFLSDGNVEFLGRTDRQVKLLGIRIELEELENVLCTCPAVKQAVVLKKRQDTNEFLCAYVTANEITGDNEVTVNDIMKYAAAELPTYMVPGTIVILDEFPKRPNGKIDYQALEAIESEIDEYMAPRSDIEKKLVKL